MNADLLDLEKGFELTPSEAMADMIYAYTLRPTDFNITAGWLRRHAGQADVEVELSEFRVHIYKGNSSFGEQERATQYFPCLLEDKLVGFLNPVSFEFTGELAETRKKELVRAFEEYLGAG